MPLTTVLSIEVRPECARAYEQLCLQLAEQAKQRGSSPSWSAHQGLIGAGNPLHFVVESEDFAGLAASARVDETVRAALGEEAAADWLQSASECIASQRQEVAVDRPELSYAPNGSDPTAPFSIITVVRARPGHQEACEELIRKVAEATPKTDDSSSLSTHQTVIGDLTQYWTARPINSLAEMDDILPAPELLSRVFGPAEGGLIYRSGMDAIERVERAITIHREELSNLPE
ncbi:MAG: hypothetical protein CL910_19370 [Deltaproteobacteria bacterium]|nr:hypothetical protein [Deltaproteobacteria bacterium]